MHELKFSSRRPTALIKYLLQGATLALSAALMPGPFQTYLISRSLKLGWKRTLPAAVAPLISDGPVIALTVFMLARTPGLFLNFVRILGGFFILYLAGNIFIRMKDSPNPVGSQNDTGATGLLNAVVLNLLNPNPYLFWSLVAGPILLSGWRESTGLGIAFLIGFYGVFVCCLVGLIIVSARAGSVHPGIRWFLNQLCCAALFLLGLYQIATGLVNLTGPG